MRHLSEPRFNTDLSVRVFGIDTDSRLFSENSQLRNISDHGAKLRGIVIQLRPGDIIGVRFHGQKARCKVAWAINLEPVDRNQGGVRVLEGEPCPWQAEREKQEAIATVPISQTPPAARDKRKFAWRSIPFPIEIRGCVRSSSELSQKVIQVRSWKRLHGLDVTDRDCKNQHPRSGYGHRFHRNRRRNSETAATATGEYGYRRQTRSGKVEFIALRPLGRHRN